MSRSIDISYKSVAGKEISIEVRPPYFLFGTQRSSMKFWSISRLKEIGIERLTILGESDPLYFWGWEDMAVLGREIELLARHLGSIGFDPETKAQWLSHLTFCHQLLIGSTPRECEPRLGIG